MRSLRISRIHPRECQGCYHTRQLLKAHQRGKIAAQRFVVVDRNPACRALTEFAAEPLVEVVRSDWARFLRTSLRERAVTVSACHGVLGELVAQPCSANSASTGR